MTKTKKTKINKILWRMIWEKVRMTKKKVVMTKKVVTTKTKKVVMTKVKINLLIQQVKLLQLPRPIHQLLQLKLPKHQSQLLQSRNEECDLDHKRIRKIHKCLA